MEPGAPCRANELQEDDKAETSVLQELEINDRIRMSLRNVGEKDQRNDGQKRGELYLSGAEPVFLLAFVEGEFEQTDAESDRAQADEVDRILPLHARL